MNECKHERVINNTCVECFEIVKSEDFADEIMGRDCCKSRKQIGDYIDDLNAHYGEECCCADDGVNNPQHYTVGGIETIDVIRAKLTTEEFIGHCKANIVKYVTRASYKGTHDKDCWKAWMYACWLAQAVGAVSGMPQAQASGGCSPDAPGAGEAS